MCAHRNCVSISRTCMIMRLASHTHTPHVQFFLRCERKPHARVPRKQFCIYTTLGDATEIMMDYKIIIRKCN